MGAGLAIGLGLVWLQQHGDTHVDLPNLNLPDPIRNSTRGSILKAWDRFTRWFFNEPEFIPLAPYDGPPLAHGKRWICSACSGKRYESYKKFPFGTGGDHDLDEAAMKAVTDLLNLIAQEPYLYRGPIRVECFHLDSPPRDGRYNHETKKVDWDSH